MITPSPQSFEPKAIRHSALRLLGITAPILLLTGAVISFLAASYLRETNRSVTHTNEVLMSLEKIISLTKDAETGQRGYLITGESPYLEPYEAALQSVDSQLTHLAELTRDSASQQSNSLALKNSVNIRLELLKDALLVFQNNGYEAARSFVLSDEGKLAMNAVRSQIAKMKAEEKSFLTQREDAAQIAFILAVSSGVLTALLGILLLVVTARLFAQKLAAESEAAQEKAWLSTTLASIGDAVIATDLQARVRFMNKTAASITGWTEEEARGTSLETVFKIVNEETRQAVENPALRALREGRIVGLANHTSLISKTGKDYPIDDSAAPIRNQDGEIIGAVLVFRDITERKQAEDALFASSKESTDLKAALDEYAIVAVSDAQGKLTAVNDKFCAISKYSREELLGQDHRIINSGYHPEAFFRDLWSTLARGRPWQGEIKNKAKDGSYYWVGTTIVPFLNAGGKPLQYVDIQADITERKQMEVELFEVGRRKDEFLATLAHELRNPLAPIRTALQVLKLDESKDPRTTRAREIMERQVVHLVRLIDDLLDIARISQGKLILEKSRITVKEVIDAALETSRPVIEAENHTLTIRTPDYPIYLDADLTRMAQIVSNLLINAAKYTPKYGTIDLSVELINKEATISITDNGAGLTADMLSKVFAIFTQVKQDLKRTQGGLGIGLALAKNFIELHGGIIQAKSEGLGKGSTFTLKLPALGESPEISAINNASQIAALSGLNRKILIVDDNIEAAEMLSVFLQSSGHQTMMVYNGNDALEAVARFEPDYILLDIGLPDISGYEVARKLSKDLGVRTPVLVALTGWDSPEDKKKAAEAGFNFHLTKPVDVEEIEAIMNHANSEDRTLISHGSPKGSVGLL